MNKKHDPNQINAIGRTPIVAHKVSFRTIGTMPLIKVCAPPSRLQGLGGRKGDASPTYMLCYHMKGGGWASDPLVRNAYKK